MQDNEILQKFETTMNKVIDLVNNNYQLTTSMHHKIDNISKILKRCQDRYHFEEDTCAICLENANLNKCKNCTCMRHATCAKQLAETQCDEFNFKYNYLICPICRRIFTKKDNVCHVVRRLRALALN